MTAALRSDEVKKGLKRSNSFLFKRHQKIKCRTDRRLSQESKESEMSEDSKEEALRMIEMHKSEATPLTGISKFSSPGKKRRRGRLGSIQNS